MYIGLPNQSPIDPANQVSVFSDVDLIQPLNQPLRTINGFISKSGSPTNIFIAETRISIAVFNKNNNLVYQNLDSPLVSTLLSTGTTQVWYDTVAAFIADLSLTLGQYIATAEYASGYGFKGGNDLKIVAAGSGVTDNIEYFDLDNGLQALAMFRDGPNILQAGCIGDDLTDNETPLQDITLFARGTELKFPKGIYRIGGDISFPDGSTGINWRGDGVEDSRIRSTSAIANGITLNGEADNLILRDLHIETNNSSSGYGISSLLTAAATPLRDCIIDNVNISGFLVGLAIYGGLGCHIKKGRVSGQGTGVANGIGLLLGKDAADGINNGSVAETYVSSFDYCIINANCAPCHLKSVVMGPSGTATLDIQNGALTEVDSCYFDGPSAVAIQSAGYVTLNNSLVSSLGAQLFTSTTTRFRTIGGAIPRVSVWRSGVQNVAPGAPVKVQFNAEQEDTENHFDPAINYRFVADKPGTFPVKCALFINVDERDKDFILKVYKQGALFKEVTYRSGGSGVTIPYDYSLFIACDVPLAANERIEIFFEHNQVAACDINSGINQTFLQIGSGL